MLLSHLRISTVHLLPTGNVCLGEEMAELRDLGAGLQACRSGHELALILPEGAPGLVFTRVDSLVRVRLQLAGGKIGADVTFQPGVVDRQLDLAARELAVDPNRWRLAALAELRQWSGALDWCPQDATALTAAVGALGHPLLRPVYELGHGALREVPRWAVPVLRAPDPTTAAAKLEPRSTRRLARALAGSLIARPSPAPVELSPLSFALVGAGLVSGDELANLLEMPVLEAPVQLPMGEDISAAKRVLDFWPPSRRIKLLIDVAARTGVAQLASTLRQLEWVWERMPLPLPVRWDELNEVRVRLVPITATPPTSRTAPAAAPQRRRAPSSRREQPTQITPALPAPPQPLGRGPAATAVRDAPQLSSALSRRAAFEQPRRAPSVTAEERVNLSSRWPIPGALQVIHHSSLNDLRFVVPTSLPELRRWGVILHNCLGDYAVAASAGRSWIVGIERNELLVGCAEVDPRTRTVRQLLGPRNRPLPADVTAATISALRASGVIRT